MTGRRRRTTFLVDVLNEAFADLVAADPAAFRGSSGRWPPTRSPSTAARPALFFADIAEREDPWADERTGRVWIQGDLHARELRHLHGRPGRAGLRRQRLRRGLPRPLHLGPAAAGGVASPCWAGARRCPTTTSPGSSRPTPGPTSTRSSEFVDRTATTSGRCGSTTPPARCATRCCEAQLATRVDLLEGVTVVDGLPAALPRRPGVRRLDDDERGRVEAAFGGYLQTIPRQQAAGQPDLRAQGRRRARAASASAARLPAYNSARRGAHRGARERRRAHHEAGQRRRHPAASPTTQVARRYFAPPRPPDRALASARCRPTPTRGSATPIEAVPRRGRVRRRGAIAVRGGPRLARSSPSPTSCAEVLEQLGRATAKVHCVSDVDEPHAAGEFQAEDAVAAVVARARGRPGRRPLAFAPGVPGARAGRPRAVRGRLPRRGCQGGDTGAARDV